MRIPLADAKRAAKYHGASVTDFVVATVSGALHDSWPPVAKRYLVT